MSDLTDYASKLAAGLTSRWIARRAAKKLAAEKLIEFAADLEQQATALGDLEARLVDALDRGDRLEEQMRRGTLDRRMAQALADFNKPSLSKEKPVAAAIIISPRQYENFRGRAFKGLPILVASGVCGPVAVSSKALDGISRQAPELGLKAV